VQFSIPIISRSQYCSRRPTVTVDAYAQPTNFESALLSLSFPNYILFVLLFNINSPGIVGVGGTRRVPDFPRANRGRLKGRGYATTPIILAPTEGPRQPAPHTALSPIHSYFVRNCATMYSVDCSLFVLPPLLPSSGQASSSRPSAGRSPGPHLFLKSVLIIILSRLGYFWGRTMSCGVFLVRSFFLPCPVSWVASLSFKRLDLRLSPFAFPITFCVMFFRYQQNRRGS